MPRELVAVCLPLLVLGAAVGAPAADLPLPEAWETAYVLLLVANPDHVPGDAEHEAAVTSGHIQHQLRLQHEGQAVAAGGFGDGDRGDLVGMTILKAGSLAEARELAAADPAVKDGRFLARVSAWWVPAGRLP
ncbi:MAG: hypothetical protein IH621_02830 [Krumholzibacteria bacterium]|nr:hypothetical protein [Candidatus Krumholzibacteria bacterium]